MASFNVAGARKAGYSDAEIAEFLAQSSKFDLAGARSAGYDDAEIVAELSKAPPAPKAAPKAASTAAPKAPAAVQPARRPAVDLAAPPPTAAQMKALATPKPSVYGSGARAPAPTALAMREFATGKRMQPSTAGAAVRGAVRGVLPTVAGALGAAGGGAAGAAVSLPLLGTGAIPGALAGGVAAGTGASVLQEKLLEKLPLGVREMLGQTDAQRQADARAHGTAAMAGEMVPGLAFGRPSAKVGELLSGALLGGGLEAARGAAMDGKVDLGRVATAGAMGAAQSKPWLAGKALIGSPDSALVRELRATDAKVPPRPAVASRKALEAAGVEPAPLDVLPSSFTERVGQESAGRSVKAGDTLRTYAETVERTLPDAAKPVTEALDVTQPGRTREQAQARAERDIAGAVASVRPGIPLGEASEAATRKLTAQRDASMSKVDALYDAHRASGSATFGEIKPQGVAPDSGEWAIMSPAELKEYGLKGPHYRNRKTSATKPADEMQGRFDDENAWVPVPEEQALAMGIEEPAYMHVASGDVKTATELGPKTIPEFTAELRDSLSKEGLMDNPDEVKGTLNILASLDTKSNLTSHDIHEVRTRLTKRAAAVASSPDGLAARIARRALDDLEARLDASGRFTGDQNVVSSHRAAVQARAEHGRQFEGKDLVQKLTEKAYRSGAVDQAVDPLAAGNVIHGGLKQTGNRLRDYEILRDRLGADSPEWEGIQQEALERVLGKMTDKPAFIEKMANWARENKDLAEVLIPPETQGLLSSAATTVRGAQGRQAAMDTAKGFLKADPTDFAASVGGMAPAARRDAKVSMRQQIRDALKSPRSSMAVLAEVAGNTDAQTNMARLLGAEETQRFVTSAKALTERVKKAKGAVGEKNPDLSDAEKLTADALKITGRAAGHSTGYGIAMMLVDILKGKGTPAQTRLRAEQLAADLTDPNKTGETLRFIERQYGASAAGRLLSRIRAQTAEHPTAFLTGAKAMPTLLAGEHSKSDEPKANMVTSDPKKADDTGAVSMEGVPIETIKQVISGQEGTKKNPSSSAVGQYQFVDKTFVAYAKKVFPEEMAGKSDAEILAYRGRTPPGSDEPIESVLMTKLTQDNADRLQAIGKPANITNLYLMHFLGEGDGPKVLKADPATPLRDIISPSAVRANSGIRFRGKRLPDFTAQDIQDWSASVMEKSAAKVGFSG